MAAAVTLCLAAAPFTLARLLGGGTITPLPELAALTPIGAVFALAALVWSLAGRSRWTAGGAAVLLGLHLLWLAPSLVANAPAPPTGPEQPLRLMTLNCYLGQADAAAIVADVRGARVDVLVLEELTPELDAELARRGLTQLLPNVRALPGGGASGIGVFSRFPLEPTGRPVTGTAFPMPRARVLLPDGSRVTVTAVHTLSPRPGQVGLWESDLRTVAQVARGTVGPQLVVGDFNASRDHASFRAILDGGKVADAADTLGPAAWPRLTWPANLWGIPPFVRLDHVLVSPAEVRVLALSTVPVPGTDHRGLLTDLTVHPADSRS